MRMGGGCLYFEFYFAILFGPFIFLFSSFAFGPNKSAAAKIIKKIPLEIADSQR